MRLTEQEVRRVAELANLALTDAEIERMARDLSDILTHVDKLNELDTSNVEPMAQVLFEGQASPGMATRHAGVRAPQLRDDVERACLSNAEAVGNAPLAGQGYFKVPKVIER